MIQEYVLDVMTVIFERFMEQRIQKLNSPEQFGMEDSLLFPIQPLPRVPTALDQKRISNTSRDSGVNSPHVSSMAMPVKPKNSQPYQMPSTTRIDPPKAPLTPIQPFFHNSPKPNTKELKYNRSQPDHLDPQSVLRTRNRQSYKRLLVASFPLTLSKKPLFVFYTLLLFLFVGTSPFLRYR